MQSLSFKRTCVRHVRSQQQRLVVRCSHSRSSSSSSKPAAQQQQQQSRRQQLLQSSALLVLLQAGEAAANVAEDLERQLPGLPAGQQAVELPKAYSRTMHKLVDALRASIEAEADGAKEAEVRRKADPAKELVREFVGKWQDNPAVAGDPSHDEMRGVLSELGRFYQSAGPRSRLSAEVKGRVLQRLAAVEAALPEQEKSLLGF